MNRRERFIQSKCDRCGKTTPAKQNGIGDLFTLPHEYADPLSDSGDFCAACIKRYDEADWMAWFREHRPEDFAQPAEAVRPPVNLGDTVTAEGVAGTPELYSLTWRIGRGRVKWECTGTNKEGTKVRFARLVACGGGFRQITCYVDPEQVMRRAS